MRVEGKMKGTSVGVRRYMVQVGEGRPWGIFPAENFCFLNMRREL